MHLIRLIEEQRILPKISVGELSELYSRLVDALLTPSFKEANPGLSRESVLNAVQARDRQGATALGNGFAYPHARLADCNGAGMAIATLSPPLGIPRTPDGRAIDTVCLLVGPENDPNLFLKAMSCFAQFVGSDVQRQALLGAENPQDAYEVLARSNLSTDIPVLAADIMRPLRLQLTADMSLRQAARQMLRQHVDAAPVMDEDNQVLGEITSDLLFKCGLPDFFSQLRSVSFIREFDPFEKYFEFEAHATTGELMSREFATLPLKATLLEIVFLLAVKRHPKVYVLDQNKKCRGVIDRILVLDRVINI